MAYPKETWTGGDTWLVGSGRWKLEVDLDQLSLDFQKQDGLQPFHAWGREYIGRHATAKEQLLKEVDGSVDSVLELFAGMGVTASIVRGRWNPAGHQLFELNGELVKHLRANGFDAAKLNAYEVEEEALRNRDIVDLDLGRFTILQWRRNATLALLLGRVFANTPRYLLVPDTSKHRIMANATRYAQALEMERPIQEWREYPRAWGELWYRLYGYSIVRAEYHAGAIYTLWEHGREPGDFPIEQHVAPYPGVVLAEPVA